jgi:hypothetical protein
MAIAAFPLLALCVLNDRINHALLGERLEQEQVRPKQLALRAVKQAVLAGQHDNRGSFKFAVIPDERACLIAIQPGHYDVDEDYIRMVVNNLGQPVKAILRKYHLASSLCQEYLPATAYGVAVIDEHCLDARQWHVIAHVHLFSETLVRWQLYGLPFSASIL